MLAAVIEYEGKILLARNAAWAGKMYALITGFMEAETPQGSALPGKFGRNQSDRK